MIGGMLAGVIGGTRLQSPRRPPAGPAGSAPVLAQVLPGRRLAGPGPGRGRFRGDGGRLAMGAFTAVSSGTGFAAAWFAVAASGWAWPCRPR